MNLSPHFNFSAVGPNSYFPHLTPESHYWALSLICRHTPQNFKPGILHLTTGGQCWTSQVSFSALLHLCPHLDLSFQDAASGWKRKPRAIGAPPEQQHSQAHYNGSLAPGIIEIKGSSLESKYSSYGDTIPWERDWEENLPGCAINQ